MVRSLVISYCVRTKPSHPNTLTCTGLNGDASASQILAPILLMDAELAIIDDPAILVDVKEQLAPHLSHCKVLDLHTNEEPCIANRQLAVGQRSANLN